MSALFGVTLDAHYLTIVLRPDEGMAQIQRALTLDPFNVRIHGFYSIVLHLARRYGEATTQARATLKMQPDNGVANSAPILSLHMMKRYDEASAAAAALCTSPMFGWPEIAGALRKEHAAPGGGAGIRLPAFGCRSLPALGRRML